MMGTFPQLPAKSLSFPLFQEETWGTAARSIKTQKWQSQPAELNPGKVCFSWAWVVCLPGHRCLEVDLGKKDDNEASSSSPSTLSKDMGHYPQEHQMLLTSEHLSSIRYSKLWSLTGSFHIAHVNSAALVSQFPGPL